MDKYKVSWGFKAKNSKKSVSRHTWSDSPEQESNPAKKTRHFSTEQESSKVKKQRNFSAEQESSQDKKKRHFSAEQESSQAKKKRHFSAEQESSQAKKKRHFSAEQESSQDKKKSHFYAVVKQEANSAKKRHFSAGNAGAKNEPDLLGSIMSGMTSPREGASEWEGQPGHNLVELGRKKQRELDGKKWDSRGEDRIVSEKTQNQYWSKDPLQLETSSSNFDNNFFMSPRSTEQVKPVHKIRKAEESGNLKALNEREKLQAKARSIDINIDKSDGKKNAKEESKEGRKSVNSQRKKLVHFSKEDRSEKGGAKMLKTVNASGRIMKEIQNTVKETEKIAGDNKKKFPREMEGTKSYQGKSSYKGSRRLGSTRTKWRPDRAYDFGKNDMEINDVETPNDVFELARVV